MDLSKEYDVMTKTFPSFPLPEELAASCLANDERIVKAKELIFEALNDHKQKLTKIHPPKPELKEYYDKLLESFASYRGGKLWYPYLGSGIGNGPFVELADGSVKYDFICGIGPHYLGHSHKELVEASIDAAIGNTIMQGHLQQNVETVELCALLSEKSGFPHCFLSTSGAMANENALKIAFQKKFPAHRLLAFEHCFAGRTLATSQITDKPSFREGLPPNLFVDYVPFFDYKEPVKSTERALRVLKTHLERYPKAHAAMLFELIQGEGGFHSGTKEFFSAIMGPLKEMGIAVIVDEVQSFARTEQLFAFQHFGLASYVDICTIGKLSQVCATLFSSDFKPRAGLLSQTFTGSTSAIKGGLALLKNVLQGGYFGPSGKIAKLHRHIASGLADLSRRHPSLIEGPFGIGSMIAFTPFNGNTEKVHAFLQRLFKAGVIAFSAGGGTTPSRVRFLLPVGAIGEREIDEVLAIVEQQLLNPDKL